ncbi:HNH endonuclease signature motif containing protein [Arthrobacter sp. SAFR-179]|uniref:HNH endonuclease signature motif containing protein n=1 Tax=Arthrobacter sp. SAFR-179 TaxID=3387279 RepID=UPI003F7C5190
MEIAGGVGTAMDGVLASVAALDALDLEDASLASDAHAGTDVDVLQRRYELRLERLEVSSRLRAQLAAVEARDAVECVGFQHVMLAPDAPVHERTFAEMSAVEEIAGVLTVSSGAAGAFVEQSRRVCALPPVLAALSTGDLSWQHAKIVADETEGLTLDGAAALVAHLFDPDAPNPARGAPPGELVPSRFRTKVRSWRERHHPETLDKRHAKGVADRRMEYTPDRDGMAWISLHLPGDTACAIWNRTTATARGLQSPNEPRTITQLRPDIAAALLLGTGSATENSATAARSGSVPAEAAATDTAPGPGNAPGADGVSDTAGLEATPEIGKVPAPRADVLVMVPVFSLLGQTDEPAVLDGFGPIPASMARKLVADGAESFYRVLVDPRDGAPLEIGRQRYRLPETIKQWIRMRDGKCTFPGCSNHTPDNDTDHLTAWEHGGTTGTNNLAQLCPKHHRLKHARPWIPDPATHNGPPGWTSPTGRHYKPEHPDPEPTHWPPGIMPVSTGTPCMEACPEDLPQWEPDDDQLIDLNDLSPEDPVWAEFFAKPFMLSV